MPKNPILLYRTKNSEAGGVRWHRMLKPASLREGFFLIDWKRKIKTYPHFDADITIENIKELVEDPAKVAKNPFLPLIRNVKVIPKFGKDRKYWKEREIYWSSRRDAYIYTQYRDLLVQLYEERLKDTGIEEVAIAYRKIPKNDVSNSGKSNIEFAIEAFQKINELKNCTAIALDISGFFDNLLHEQVYKTLCKTLNAKALPEDYLAIFKSITNFKYVDYIPAMTALGLYGDIKIGGVLKKGHLIGKKQIKRNGNQLCSVQEFREKICGQGKKYPNLVQENKREIRGIPQGTPISDIIANIYMIEFDIALNKYCNSHKIYFRRYSDDILIIVPEGGIDSATVIDDLERLMELYCGGLEIKHSKTQIRNFTDVSGIPTSVERKQFEYLGIGFDRNVAYLRTSTVSRLQQKAITTARYEAMVARRRYRNLKNSEIFSKKFGDLHKKFKQNVDFEFDNQKSWTFWTYAKRLDKAISIAGFDSKVFHQIRSIKAKLKDEFLKHL